MFFDAFEMNVRQNLKEVIFMIRELSSTPIDIPHVTSLLIGRGSNSAQLQSIPGALLSLHQCPICLPSLAVSALVENE